ncbi:t-SNARE [Schizophyllum commune]
MSSPTTRSRTLFFLSCRPKRRRARLYEDEDDEDDDERGGLIKRRAVAVDVDLAPQWADTADNVETLLAGIQTKIAMLDKLHAKHLLPAFADRSKEEQDIDRLTSEITSDFRACHSQVTRVAQHAFPPTAAPSQAARNVQRALAAKVQTLSATFRKKQRNYMQKLQSQNLSSSGIPGTPRSPVSPRLGALDLDTGVDDDLRFARQTQQQAFATQIDEPDQAYAERTRELSDIADSIAQLADLFRELEGLVIDQGTLLDSVEYNIEQTAVQMEDAVKELNTAVKYQKNTGRRACIFLLILVIIALATALAVRPRGGHDDNTSSQPVESGADGSETR